MTEPLLAAIDKLTRDRQVPTTIVDEDTGEWLEVHIETHPPLLTLLREGTGITSGTGGGSSDPGAPIDADALEIESQIRERVSTWCGWLTLQYDRHNLAGSLRRWYGAHMRELQDARVSELTHLEMTRTVEQWVRMIESKFDPDKKREWTTPCPALVPAVWGDESDPTYRRCGAHRVIVDGLERYAITVNVTRRFAVCASCGTRWEGLGGLEQLRAAADEAAEEQEGITE